MINDEGVIPELRDYPAIMTTAQVAEVLQLDESSVRRQIGSGHLAGFRVGSRGLRVRRADLQKLILGENEGGGSQP